MLARLVGKLSSREGIDSDKTSIFIIAVGYDQDSKCLLLNAMKRKENAFGNLSCRTSLYQKKVRDDYTIRGRNFNLVQTPSLNTPGWQRVTNQLLHGKEWTERSRLFVYVREADASNVTDAMSLKNLKETFKNDFVFGVDCYSCKVGLNVEEVQSKDEEFPYRFCIDWDWSSRVRKAKEILEQIMEVALTRVPQVQVDEGPSQVGSERRADKTQSPSVNKDVEDLMATVNVETGTTEHRSRIKEKLTKEDWAIFQTALRYGSARSNHVRVNVVGNHGVGKTTVIKRLLMKENVKCPDPKPKPTENLEIHRLTARCSEKDGTKTWETGDQDMFLDELNIQRMAQAMQQTMRTLKHSGSSESNLSSLQSQPDTPPDSSLSSLSSQLDSLPVGDQFNTAVTHSAESGDNRADTTNDAAEKTGSRSPHNRENESDMFLGSEEFMDDMSMTDDAMPTSSHSTSSSFFSPVSPMSVLKNKESYLREVLNKVESLKKNKGEHMYVSYWDYAGQSTYYATHQLFLSPSAVYLLVVDLRKELTDRIDDNLDFRSGVLQSCTVADAIKFWVHSIQAYTKDNHDGHAPFIVVGTHLGDIKDEDKVQRRFQAIREISDAITECIAIDNTLDPKDEKNLIKLRNRIIDKGLGIIDEKVSSQWINLEWDMQISKECQKGYIRYSKLQELDKNLDLPMLKKDRLEAFLCHQHYRGHLLFYQHQDLNDLIITDPMILVNFLNCIFRRSVTGLCGLTSGRNEDGILDHKYFLQVGKTIDIEEYACMTLLNILMKLHILHPLKLESSVGVQNQYFMPCLLKDKHQEEKVEPDECLYSPTFQITFDHDSLYQTTYHQIVCALMKRIKVIEEKGKKLIYNLHASFEIDGNFVWLDLNWKDCRINFQIKDYTNRENKDMNQYVDDAIVNLENAIEDVLFVNQHNRIGYEFCVECPTHKGSFLKLEELKKKKASMCTGRVQGDGGRHRVKIEKIPAVAGGKCEEQIEDPVLQQKPDDTMLARLAWKLKTLNENARTLAVLLNLHIAYAKADMVTRDYDDPGSELFHILHSWRNDQPSDCTCSALFKLLTKNYVYDSDMLKAAMFTPECTDNRIDAISEEASTDNLDIVVVSDHVGAGYTFMLLEVGVKWTEIQQQRRNYRDDTSSMVRDLLKGQRRSVPGDLTTKRILKAAKMIEVPLEPVISKLKSQTA